MANRADEIFLEADEAGRELVRQMFLRQVTLGEGAEDTRRRVNRDELLAIADVPDLMEEIIDLYATSRLLALDHDPATRRPTVEVAHEAILREWDRLRGWLNESREDIRQQRIVAEAATAWDTHDCDASYLLTGTRLEQAEHWANLTDLALVPLESEFLNVSIAERERQRQIEQEQQEREVALKQRAQRVLQVLVVVFLFAAVISGGMAIFAFDREGKARDSEHEARRQASIGLAAMALRELDSGNQNRAVLLALEALEHYPHTSQAESALADAVEAYIPRDEELEEEYLPYRATWSPDGTRIAMVEEHVTEEGSMDDFIVIWDAGTSALHSTLSLGALGCSAWDMAWSPAGDRLVSNYMTHTYSSADCLVPPAVWDVATGEVLFQITGHEGQVSRLDWSPDGTTILTAGADGTVRLYISWIHPERAIFPTSCRNA